VVKYFLTLLRSTFSSVHFIGIEKSLEKIPKVPISSQPFNAASASFALMNQHIMTENRLILANQVTEPHGRLSYKIHVILILTLSIIRLYTATQSTCPIGKQITCPTWTTICTKPCLYIFKQDTLEIIILINKYILDSFCSGDFLRNGT